MAGSDGEVKSLKLPWQLAHSPWGWLASATKKVPDVVCGRVWKPLNGALVVIGYLAMPIHTKLLSWQLEQLPVTPAWICAAVGTGFKKPLPGGRLGATPAISPDGVLPAWQLSQVVEVGRCELLPGAVLGGITTI